MKFVISMLCAAMALGACNQADKTASAPAIPKSIADVATAIKGKQYKVANLGLLSPFASDSANPVNWKIQQEDTSKFFRDYVAKQQPFTIGFSADSTVRFWDVNNGKQVTGTFSVDDAVNEGYDGPEKAGIKLRVRYADSLDLGGQKSAAPMTQSYLVRGLGGNELVVETGQSYNRRTVVLWLKAEVPLERPH
jgi:hypothetical protein